MKRWGDGLKCSASGSAARSDSTGLHTACPFHAAVPTLACMCALHESAAVLVNACRAGAWVLHGFVAACVALLRARGWLFVAAYALLFLLKVGVALLYGGEANEAIRFMNTVPQQMEEYVAQLAAAMLALEELPLVTGVSLFGDGVDLNLTGALAAATLAAAALAAATLAAAALAAAALAAALAAAARRVRGNLAEIHLALYESRGRARRM